MNRRSLLAAGALAVASIPITARGQTGKDPGEAMGPDVKKPYGSPITIDQARRVLNAAAAVADQKQVAVVISVVDSGGNLVAFERLDGALLAAITVSQDKARAALTFRRGTHELDAALRAGHNSLLSIDGFVASPGGLPLVLKDKVVVGAIGVSGAGATDNREIADAGAGAFKRATASAS